MCKKDKRIEEQVENMPLIEAPLPECIMYAIELLEKVGYVKGRDFVEISPQYQNSYTRIFYKKSTKDLEVNPETGEKDECHNFVIKYPDRYKISTKAEKIPGVIRCKEDIERLFP